MTLEEIEQFIAGLGKERYRAVQIMKWVHQALADSFANMTNLSKALREELAERSTICRPTVAGIASSDDGTKKFLLALHDGNHIEAVLIPGEDHGTLCVSTQVGCAMGCRFCRTAKIGLKRNLNAAEIVAQLLTVRREVPDSRITNVVFMGMGEPLANLDETRRAVNIMTHPNGPQVSWRRLTVSTSGLVPQIRELGATSRVKLAVSLNAVNDEQRNAVMPINRKYPLAELLGCLKEYPLQRGHRITIEYVLIAGLNDSDADARQLVRILNPIKAKINLIPLNDDPESELRAPSPQRVQRFQDILMSRSLVAVVRRSRGSDIMAACGQLAARESASL
jgi:23S rRNA (adenine2503-C2)-methyltransferase